MNGHSQIHDISGRAFSVRKIGEEVAALRNARRPVPNGDGDRRLLISRQPISDSTSACEELVRLSDDLWLMKVQGSDIRQRSAIYVGEDLFKVHFRLRGESSISFRPDDAFRLQGQACGIMLHPSGLEKMETTHGGDESWITIFCKPAVLTDTFDLPGSRLPPDFKPFLDGGELSLYNRQVPLNAEMVMNVAALFRDPVDDGVRRVFTEAKVMDLLCQVIMHLTEDADTGNRLRLTARERARLNEVRDHLDAQYASPPGLSALSRRAGMNQSKLTAGFRQCFGLSIHEYCLERRMTEALTMLRAGHGSITEIAAAVGYDYPGNFTAAFKRHFGLTPRIAAQGFPRSN